MKLFEHMGDKGHEQVVFCHDRSSGLKAIIAIHHTGLGPALGGLRMWPYHSEEDALKDVLRLSRGMTFKAAAAGLSLGGGKAVIIGDPKKDKTEKLFRAFGRFVESLGGRYITAEDVGTSVRDIEWVSMETRHVTGLSHARGSSGDPSPVTAYGAYWGMKACAKEVWGSDSLKGKRVAIQGVGNVGYHLASHLAKEGALLVVTDIDAENLARTVTEFKAEKVKPHEIYDVECDIFAPCALGAILNDTTIPRLSCSIVCGAANNQLEEEARHGSMLQERGILYGPDYVVNAGGIINISHERGGEYHQDKAMEQTRGIFDTMTRVIHLAKEENIPTNVAADRLAMERLGG